MTKSNTGILLTNIGTPDAPTASEVRRYLKEFLSDKRVVNLPSIIWQPILQGWILPFRSRQSAKLYQKIWTKEGSPLLIHSKNIAEKLTKQLQIPVELGMHYGKPSIKTALKKLRDKKMENLIILPLFPQFSATTTAATFDQVAAELKTWRKLPAIRMIDHYADSANYIAALTESVQQYWQEHGRAPHLLFSFHGIPEKHVAAGDPYPEQCRLTAKLVSEKLNLQPNEWSIAFQSRLGRAKWLSPYTDHTLRTLPKRGVKHVQVLCPGFAVDCLETLEEIAIRGKEQFLQAGGEHFQYIPALNDQDKQIQLLISLHGK